MKAVTRHLTKRGDGKGLVVMSATQKANKAALGGTMGQGEGWMSSPFKTSALRHKG